MPTYEYKCKKCGKEFEIQQRITEDPLTVCPDENCKGEIFRKISKNVGLVFKGSGFYLTDYANKHDSTANNGNGHHDNNSDGSNKEIKSEKKNVSSENKKVSKKEKSTV